jgi:hypothetical protein
VVVRTEVEEGGVRVLGAEDLDVDVDVEGGVDSIFGSLSRLLFLDVSFRVGGCFSEDCTTDFRGLEGI